MELKDATVAVTGASGFVGRYLVRALLGRGARVVAVVRDPAKLPALHRPGVEVRTADLADRAALVRAFAGCDALLANAGVVGLGGRSPAELEAANVSGTANTLRAAHEAGVRRVVFTSSATVYLPRRDHTYCEDHPLWGPEHRPDRFRAYAWSKALAERAAWRLADELGLDLSTVRPHSIHGAFDPTGVTLWLRRLMRGPVSAWPTHMAFPSVYAGDLAEAVMRMLERPVAIGRAYNVTGTDDTDFWALFEAWRAAGGPTPAVVLPVPLPMRRRFDIRRVTADLDWSNRPLVDGFREILALEAAGDL